MSKKITKLNSKLGTFIHTLPKNSDLRFHGAAASTETLAVSKPFERLPPKKRLQPIVWTAWYGLWWSTSHCIHLKTRISWTSFFKVTLFWTYKGHFQGLRPFQESKGHFEESGSCFFLEQKQALGIQSPCQMMIWVYNHLLSKVFKFHETILRRWLDP